MQAADGYPGGNGLNDSMNMPVMNVRVVRMAMLDGEVRVPVTVLYGFEAVEPMRMLMVLVMDVLVLMFLNIV